TSLPSVLTFVDRRPKSEVRRCSLYLPTFVSPLRFGRRTATGSASVLGRRSSVVSDPHLNRLLAPEGHPHLAKQRHRHVVPSCRGHERDVHSVHLLDLVEVDFRKDHLLLDAERVI